MSVKRVKTTKTETIVTPERVRRHLQSRFNPIRNLTPQSLSTMLDSYSAGYLREFALAAEKIEERDDILKSVVPKRQKSVSRHGWEVCTVEDSREAARHKKALEAFYNNLECTHALNRNQRGGFKLMIRQMMDAIGKGLAVHEIIWKPDGAELRAEFVFTPLWFFENTTGRLRFLRDDFQQYGVELEPDGWLVTASDALMPASAVAWMFKNLSLKDWVTYCERHGMPGIRGVTNAARGSTEWNDMVDAVSNFAQDFAAVMSGSERIEAIDLKGSGELPYPSLVERMDRALATIWRGADLSTLSQGGDSAGASLQGDETDLIEQDDAEMIAETLNMQVEPVVLRYSFGDNVEPLAYVRIPIPAKRDTAKDIQVDTFLASHGVQLSKSDALERYGRSETETEEDALAAPEPAQAVASTQPDQAEPAALDGLMDNEGAANGGLRKLSQAIAGDLKPVLTRLLAILDIEDAEIRAAKLAAFKNDFARLAKDVLADPGAAGVMEDELYKSFVSGLSSKLTRPAKIANINENHDPGNGQFASGGSSSSPKSDADSEKEERLKERARRKSPMAAEEQKEIIRDVVARANDPEDQDGEDFGRVSDKAAAKAKEAGFEISGYTKRIEPDAIRHIRSHHSDDQKEKARGQIAITNEDFDKLPSILDDPDDVIKGEPSEGSNNLQFKKKINDDYTLTVEMRKGRRRLGIVSFWKS